MPDSSHRVDTLLRSAYRRSLLVLSIEQAALPVFLFLAGATLLLVAGTQILDWYWPVILLGIGLLAGFLRIRNRVPNPYGVAQILDRHLTLNDTISTAWFLHQHPELASTHAGKWQLAQAEALATAIDSTSALPIRGSRSWAITAALAAVVFGLFCARYLVRHDLDLRQPLLPMHLNAITERVSEAWSAAEKRLARLTSRANQGDGTQTASTELRDAQRNDITGLKNSGSAGSEPAGESRNFQSPRAFPNGAQDAAGMKGASHDNKSGSSPTGDSRPSNSPAQQKNGNTQPKNPSSEPGQGLVNRMKDAMSSLMAKMSSSAASKSSSKSTARSAAAPDQDQAQASGDRSQSQTSASQNAQNTPNAQANGEAQGQAVEMPQPAASQISRNAPQQGGNQSKSGVGRQDGSKSLKEAEELKAMGKLAEIIGKRSQEVTGDAVVDAPSGKQQLRTAYTGEVSQHSDKGGEINRDEVPLEFQQYVREYMARVHQQGSKAE